MVADLSNKSYPDIWVLVDNRTGGANQALALAARLSPRYQVKNIKYNKHQLRFIIRIIPIFIDYK